MKIGWCESLQNASLLREIGYDFVELPLAPMGLEARETLEAAKREVQNSPLPPLAFKFGLSVYRAIGWPRPAQERQADLTQSHDPTPAA
jgi:hypothetical protein